MKKLIFLVTIFANIIIHAQTVNIPDANFKNALLSHDPIIDTNSDGEIQVSEAEVVNIIDVSNKLISNLTGIEAFVNLEQLSCFYNDISIFDVSSHVYLTHLDCGSNNLSSIDISNNIDLIEFSCYNNDLDYLNLDNNINLTTLYCSSNSLTNLNISNNTELTEIDCAANYLNNLDVSNNINLTHLEFQGNNLTYIDISNNIALVHLNCDANDLFNLDVSINISLNHLTCALNHLTALDVSNNAELNLLACSINELSTLDLSNNVELNTLFCNDNPYLTYINLKNGNNENFQNHSNFHDLPNLESVCVDSLNSDLVTLIEEHVGHGITFTEDCSIGIRDETQINFSIFPSPVTDILNIGLDEAVVSIKVYNQLGMIISENYDKKSIDLSNLTSGIYVIEIKCYNDFIGVKRFIKK